MNSEMTIPYEVADGITLATLKNDYLQLTEELRKHKEEGKWMHPFDVENYQNNILPALKCLIDYYGGIVDE